MSIASKSSATGGRSSSKSSTACAISSSFGGCGGTTSSTRIRSGAGSKMKFTCWKRPCTTVTRAFLRHAREL